MSDSITPYTIYLKTFTSLNEGCRINAGSFYHVDDNFFGGYSSTPYNEQQTLAATIAIQDHKESKPLRKKSELTKALDEALG